MSKEVLNITINDEPRELLVAPQRTLLELLREDLSLSGTKFGCELGECGACTVLIDGVATLACITLAHLCDGADVRTIEGMKGDEFEKVENAFRATGATQCGYCTPAMALVMSKMRTTGDEAEARRALSGNICRCTGYEKIIDAWKSLEERGNG